MCLSCPPIRTDRQRGLQRLYVHPISVVQAAARAAESAATSVVEDAKAAVEEVEGTEVGLYETHAIKEAAEEVEGAQVRLYDTHALKEAVGENAAVDVVEGTQGRAT